MPTEIDRDWFARHPLPQPQHGGKDDRGHLLIAGGSAEMPGSLILAANAAFRAGAGRVTLATLPALALPVAIAVPEARVIALESQLGAAERLHQAAPKPDALLIGPGLFPSEALDLLASSLLTVYNDIPVILDAGAICAVDSRAWTSHARVLVTPHCGELARLGFGTREEVSEDPAAIALWAARKYGITVALKGAVTHVGTPDGKLWRHEGGNPGLGISGSGDVLAGIIGGLAARGATLEQAALWAVAAHARAGDLLAADIGPLGYLPRELLDEVPGVLASLQAAD